MGSSLKLQVFVAVETTLVLLLIFNVPSTSPLPYLIQFPYRNLRMGPTTEKTTITAVTVTSNEVDDDKGSSIPNKICLLPPEDPNATFMCAAGFQMFTFNSKEGVCEEHIYGGCNGSQNLFLTEQECRETCVTASPI